MKKLLFTLMLVCFSAAAFAGGWQNALEFRTGKHFTQYAAAVKKDLSLNFSAGLKAKYSDEEAFEKPIFSVYVPLQLDYDLFQLNVTPFYYFKNNSHDTRYQNATAFGLSTRLVLTLQDDTVSDMYTHAYIGASYARQDGTVFYNNDTFSNQSYSQFAYTLGLHKNFFRAFSFETAANVFQYPDGIKHVTGLRGIMDQQDLAFTQSYDITHDLMKYALSARLTRLWTERQASLYLGYRFGEFYAAEEEHSFLLGNTFACTETVKANLGYNHIRTVHNHNKRDILYVQLVASF